MTSPRGPRLFVSMPNFGDWAGGLPDLVAATARLDKTSVDGIVVVDHVTLGAGLDGYPFGTFPSGPEAIWHDPLVTLSAMAAVTDRLVLATGILVVPLRPATVVAKMVATLDVLSGGRVDLGVGPGWYSGEFDAAGVDFATRGQRMEDTVAACRALWIGQSTTFTSPTVELDDVWCQPTPVQERLPVLFAGAMGGRNLQRILAHGDGWIPRPDADAQNVVDGAGTLRSAWDEAGRAGQPSIRTAWRLLKKDDGSIDVDASREAVQAYLDAGVTDLVVHGPGLVGSGGIDALLERAETLAAALR
ncbi:MAG: TIGR03619 family F420-dependent LLM class oxidoreductase [Aquihabitans sp.]